jgi:hypothetical protein
MKRHEHRPYNYDVLNIDYFKRNEDELRNKYSGNLVAILDEGSILKVSPEDIDIWDIRSFREYLEEEYGEELTESAYIQYVSPSKRFQSY